MCVLYVCVCGRGGDFRSLVNYVPTFLQAVQSCCCIFVLVMLPYWAELLGPVQDPWVLYFSQATHGGSAENGLHPNHWTITTCWHAFTCKVKAESSFTSALSIPPPKWNSPAHWQWKPKTKPLLRLMQIMSFKDSSLETAQRAAPVDEGRKYTKQVVSNLKWVPRKGVTDPKPTSEPQR